MNNSDQLRKLARQNALFMCLPTLVALSITYALLVSGQIAWSGGAIGAAFTWLTWSTIMSLHYIKHSEDGNTR